MLALELHSHTHASEDSLSRPADIVRTCRRRGIDRIAITDHNAISGALEAQALAPELVIVGEEIMTTQGELLAYFVKERIPPKLDPFETIRRLRAQGAAISVSHPFDRYRGGAWQEQDLRGIVALVDAIEVFNARCVHAEDNARALAFARELDGAEGETFPGWVLYPDDAKRRIEVFLEETGTHPASLRINAENSPWRRADGVRIGLTSAELQAMNGKPFEFLGFDWDYGGAITDWHEGKLAAANGGGGPVQLCPPASVPEHYPSGDALFPSDDPGMVASPATVCEFGVDIGEDRD